MIALAERTATNAPIQGTAADIIKIAMVDVDIMLRAENWHDKIFPTLQIHDELVYEVPDELVKLFAAKLKVVMESVMTSHHELIDSSVAKALDVPITVSVEAGINLENMKSVG